MNSMLKYYGIDLALAILEAPKVECFVNAVEYLIFTSLNHKRVGAALVSYGFLLSRFI